MEVAQVRSQVLSHRRSGRWREAGVGRLKKRCECSPLFSLWALGLRTVRAVGVRRTLARVDCYMACNWVLSCLGRVFRRAQARLNGLRLLLHVVRTNDT